MPFTRFTTVVRREAHAVYSPRFEPSATDPPPVPADVEYNISNVSIFSKGALSVPDAFSIQTPDFRRNPVPYSCRARRHTSTSDNRYRYDNEVWRRPHAFLAASRTPVAGTFSVELARSYNVVLCGSCTARKLGLYLNKNKTMKSIRNVVNVIFIYIRTYTYVF